MEKIKLKIPKFKGIDTNLRFIHLSDLHISEFGQREKRLVSLVNQEKPDVIMITGDLVVNFKNDFSACIQTLQKLKAKYGIFIVFGNAEHTFYPIEFQYNFIKSLEDINVTLLNNQNVELNLNRKKLHLVGVDDPFYHFDNLEEAIKSVPSGSPTILLAHSPDILFPRTDALTVNLLDSPYKKDHFKKWGWEDSTHYSPDDGDVYFQSNSIQTLRIQTRQDGVFLDTILLNPYKKIDCMIANRDFENINQLLTTKNMRAHYPDLIIIPASSVDEHKIFGKWKKRHDPSTLFNVRLDDLPSRKTWQFQPLINPIDYFEVNFIPRKGIKYHLWIRMKAYNGSTLNDSVYLQFSHSVDKHGKEKYCIGKPAYSKDRMNDVDLILTGHTHGGQVRIPFFGPIHTMTSIGKKYASGLHRFGETLLYVSRGVGTSIFPIRFFCPPEITVFNFT